MKKIQKAIFITFFIISFNLYSQNTQNTNSILSDIMSGKNYNAERDKLTSKINIFTSWKETYKYMRDGKFRFYKKFGKSLTLEFRYRSPHKIYVNNQTPIIFNFEDGSETQLYNIQKVKKSINLLYVFEILAITIILESVNTYLLNRRMLSKNINKILRGDL